MTATQIGEVYKIQTQKVTAVETTGNKQRKTQQKDLSQKGGPSRRGYL